MILGKKNQFAVEYEVEDIIDGWFLGRFRLWINNKFIGDWEDSSVDLKGCFNWLPTLIDGRVSRKENSLDSMNGKEILLAIFDSVYAVPQRSTIKDAFSRFHIGHVGMSSFEQFDVVLIETGETIRFIWRDFQKHVYDEQVSKTFFIGVLHESRLTADVIFKLHTD